MGLIEQTERYCSMKPKIHDKSAPVHDEPFGVVVRLRPVLELGPDQLLELSSLNRDLRLELTSEGELIIMTPARGWSSKRNFNLAGQLWAWVRQDGTGTAFDSSGSFVLPNGAIRSPDVSWVENSRLEALSTEEREKYLPLCPDFVIELRSPTDGLRALQEKMTEYLENGTKLGWLLDPGRKRVYVYRPGEPVQELKDPRTISGEPVLPGFVLDLGEVW
jgi:Uma2 family endonuclease